MADTSLPKSWKEAKKKGAKHFFTGRKCFYGHLDKRQTSNGSCLTCSRLRAEKWKHDHPIRHKRWYENHYAEFLQKRMESAGRLKPDACEICGHPDGSGKWRICYEHCHKTNIFRGWTCSRCNSIIALCDESPELLMGIIRYLKKNKNY